jgi:chemotaxis protein methyltransferase CheR
VTRSADRLAFDAVEPMGETEFEAIRDLAHGAFGLDLKPGKEELVRSRLRKVLRGGNFHSFREYCEHVRGDRTGAALAVMIDALTTNHTAFLREPEHFRFLQEAIPHFKPGPVRVWSAACSTGEEVWSLACSLKDAAPAREIQIAASDISGKALAAAAAAVYPAERCEDLPAAWKARYFAAEGRPVARYRVAEEIRRLATLRRVNLIEAFPWPQPFSAIFCRNVMIYFDRETRERVVARLAECLDPGGYLFAGHAESLSRIGHSLEYVRPAVYRKRGKQQGVWSRS